MADHSADQIAVVTGTSTGVGEAVARQLLDRGWRVIGIARRPAPFTHAAYRHIGYDLADVTADASPLEAQLETHVRGVNAKRVGLVNNAASPEGLVPLANLDTRLLARIYAVNAIAPMWLMGYAVRSTPSDRALRIVNVSTGAATIGFPGLAAYGSSKAALRLAGMSLAGEWDAGGIAKSTPRNAAIVSYEPGIVETDMQRYARSRSPAEFPWVGIFLDFEARGLAVPPERPAADIVAFLESDQQPSFAESRLRS